MKRMICYRRVSTDEQADRGYSLPSQHDSIQSYANQNGFQIVADFADDCSGAIPLADRPEGGKAVAMLKRKGVDGLIAHHVDRLSRDLVDALATVRDLTRSGLEIHTLDVGRIDAETGIVLVIKAWQGSDERKKIAERSKRGRDTKARNGKVVGVGEPLYGFRYAMADRKRVGYETFEPEARVIRNIFTWYVEGDEKRQPLPIYGIARRLSEAGIPTPGEADVRLTPRKRASGIWNQTTVSRSLSNPAYEGTWAYGKLKRDPQGKLIKRAADDTIAITVPTIVPAEIWHAAQQRKEANKIAATRHAKREYLLSGLVRCECGYTMTGMMSHERRIYRCASRPAKPLCLDEICNQWVDGQKLDWAAWDFVLSVIKQRDRFPEWLKQAQAAEPETLQPARQELETIEALSEQAEVEAAEGAAAMTKTRGIVAKNWKRKPMKLTPVMTNC